MCCVRKAKREDVGRIAEILVFNYRLNFYPIFQNDEFYFKELTVSKQAEYYSKVLDNVWVYDDGVVKAFIQVESQEIKKLFVEPSLQGKSIGGELLKYILQHKKANFLWALEKNKKAIAFYQRQGFVLTEERKYEEDSTEYLVRMDFT